MSITRQSRFEKHIAGFIDRHRWPAYEPGRVEWKWFLILQTHGPKRITSERLPDIEPLIYAQKCKEITLAMFAQELAEWWSKGWGWDAPMQAMLQSIKGDWMFKRAVLKIKRKIIREGMVAFIESNTGIPRKQKQRYLATVIA